MNLHIKAVSFTIFLLNTFLLYANQLPYVINISKDKYKAANKNWSVSQDEKGCMYFGNDLGLLEFNGTEWRKYELSNSPLIRAVAALSHQIVYTGGFEDFGSWERDEFGQMYYRSLKYLLEGSSLKNEDVWKIQIHGQYIYFQTFKNIYAYDRQAETVVPLTPGNGFLFLLTAGNDLLVQETFGPIFRVEGESIRMLPGSERFAGDVIRVILPYKHSGYLIGSSTGEIYIFENGNYTIWNEHLTKELKGKELNCAVYSPRRDIYYFGTLIDGLYVVDAKGNILQHYSFNNYLKNNTVLSVFEDDSANIWLAMDRGLSYLRYDEGMSYYRSVKGDVGAVYDAISWNGKYYIGTNQGLYKISQELILSDLEMIQGTQGQVWSVREVDGALMIGHNSGLLRVDKNGTVSEPYRFNTGVYRIIPLTIKGREIYIVNTYKNLWLVDKKTGDMHRMQQIKEPVEFVEVDHMDNIWMSTFRGGVYRCRFENDLLSFRYLSYFDNNNHSEIPKHLSVFKLNGRLLFVGDRGVWFYEESRDKFERDSVLNTCFTNQARLKKLIPQHGDFSWLVTESSVHRFAYDGHEAKLGLSYKLNSRGLSLITESENIAVLNDTVSMICLDEGFILHTAENKIDKEQIQLPVPELVSISTETEDRESTGYMPDKNIAIPYRYHNLNFSFILKDVFANNLFIQYKLDEVDADWSEPVKTNHASYDRLPAGEKTFCLRSTDGMGNFSECVVFKFRILRPWYKSIFAILCYMILLIGLFAIIIIGIKRHYRKKLFLKLKEQEAFSLRQQNLALRSEIEAKNAELLTQTSFIIQKNELILKLKGMVDEFSLKTSHKSLSTVSHKMNSMIENNMDTQEDWKMFLLKFEEKHTGFFRKLKEIHPQLTNNDLRLCACLKLNMDTKDIASLMCISVRAVENNRYRIRKKLDLPSSSNLNDYFLYIE